MRQNSEKAAESTALNKIGRALLFLGGIGSVVGYVAWVLGNHQVVVWTYLSVFGMWGVAILILRMTEEG